MVLLHSHWIWAIREKNWWSKNAVFSQRQIYRQFWIYAVESVNMCVLSEFESDLSSDYCLPFSMIISTWANELVTLFLVNFKNEDKAWNSSPFSFPRSEWWLLINIPLLPIHYRSFHSSFKKIFAQTYSWAKKKQHCFVLSKSINLNSQQVCLSRGKQNK